MIDVHARAKLLSEQISARHPGRSLGFRRKMPPRSYILIFTMADLGCSRARFALLALFAVALRAETLVDPGSIQEKDQLAKASYFVDGLVAHPGEYPIDDAINASQALKKAGGVLQSTSWRIYIIRGAGHRKLRFSGPLDPQLERISMAAGDHLVVP